MRNLQRSSAEKSEVGLSSHDEVIISKHDQKKFSRLGKEREREGERREGKIKTYNPTNLTALSTQSRVLALLVEFVDRLGASGD